MQNFTLLGSCYSIGIALLALSFFLCKLLVVLGFTVYEVVLVFTVGAVRKKIDERDMPRY